MDLIIPIIIALVLVIIAWKVVAGLAKTVVLVVILAAAALWVWQSGALAGALA
ncbi:MAG: hypothetical protein JY451_13485 [Erythrobacter sp.]|nr:MAG: hypothetical protein JY451_13485 [Erythrobacter sp.]